MYIFAKKKQKLKLLYLFTCPFFCCCCTFINCLYVLQVSLILNFVLLFDYHFGMHFLQICAAFICCHVVSAISFITLPCSDSAQRAIDLIYINATEQQHILPLHSHRHTNIRPQIVECVGFFFFFCSLKRDAGRIHKNIFEKYQYFVNICRYNVLYMFFENETRGTYVSRWRCVCFSCVTR